MTRPIVVDFETKPIEKGNPRKPEPVSLAIKNLTPRPRFMAWGHASNNGIYELDAKGKLIKLPGNPLSMAKTMMADAVKGKVLGHNVCKFDLPVAEDHWGIKPPQWNDVDDTLFELFLDDPHAADHRLKSSSERLLDLPPTEQNEVFDWLAANGKIAKPKRREGVLRYPKDAGAHIWEAPGDVVAKYGIGDVERPEKLHALLLPRLAEAGMMKPYLTELRLAPILLANERSGLRVDVAKLEPDLAMYEKALVKADAWIRKALKAPTLSLDSDDDTAAAIKKAKALKGEFPKTPTGKDSVSKKVLTLDKFKDPKLWHALYYRNALTNVLIMSLRPWMTQAVKNKHYIVTEWNQIRSANDHGSRGARSGRVTCSYFANVTKDYDDRGDGYEHPKFLGVPPLPLARDYLLPDLGDDWGHIDYNQQELRLVAHYEDGALAKAYRENPSTDIHQFVKDLIKSVTGRDLPRKYVKMINFRTVYGGGAHGLVSGPNSLNLDVIYKCEPGCPHQTCPAKLAAKEMIGAWRKALPDVVQLDRACRETFQEGGTLRTIGGRLYRVKPPSVAKKGPRKGEWVDYSYTGLNYLIQPSGADVTKQALILYEQARKYGRLLTTVYDEINLSVPKGQRGTEEMQILKDCMESIQLDVPWRSGMKRGGSWGSLEDVEEA